jgi:nitrous oxidase accessory protein NosD
MSPDAPTPDDQATGDVRVLAGRYQLLGQLGQGGMGAVFRAHDVQLERPVAIKMLPEGSAPDAAAVARFRREAKALARLSHPGIIQAHDSGEEAARPFLVMELVEGRTLAGLLCEQERVAPARAADFAYQAALALHHAHQSGLVHRDVKPSNLLLSADGRVRLLDLGLARFLQDQVGDGTLTREGAGMGTPDYAPPEQFHDAHRADPRSDIYSLGCTLYHLIAGRVPFPGSSLSEKALAHEATDPPALEETCPDMPAGLALVVRRMMAKRPADRFRTMAEVAEALQPYVSAQSPSVANLLKTATWDGGRLSTMLAPPRRSRAALPWVAAGVAAAVAVTVVAAVGLAAGWFGPRAAAVADNAGSQSPTGGPEAGPPASIPEPAPPADPNVLTVSQDPGDRAQFRSISDALAQVVRPGMTVRILDTGVYRESVAILNPGLQEGLTLEALQGATLQAPATARNGLMVEDVPRVTVRGLRVRAESPNCFLCGLKGNCPGALFDEVECRGSGPNQNFGITVQSCGLGPADPPIVIRNCTASGLLGGIRVLGHDGTARAMPSRRVVFRDNRVSDCVIGLYASGAVSELRVVGNQVWKCGKTDLWLNELFEGSGGILVANNTFFDRRDNIVLENARGEVRDITIRNNLLLAGEGPDLALRPTDSPRGNMLVADNWRQARPSAKDGPESKGWVLSEKDHLAERIDVLSRDPSALDFLRPAKESPLATAGAGNEAPSLPRYVGALPPEGVEPWDWDRAWRMPKSAELLTVSKEPSGGGKHRTISEALKDPKPWATVRVLDAETYEEAIALTDRKKYEGLTLEAVKGATLLLPNDRHNLITITDVPHVRIAGLRCADRGLSPDPTRAFVVVSGALPGVALTHLELTPKSPMYGIEVQNAKAPGQAPLRIEHCTIRPQTSRQFPTSNDGINIVGNLGGDPTAGLCIRSNRITGCARGIILRGSLRDVHVTGNLLANCRDVGVQLEDVAPMSSGLLVANNTAFACASDFRVWDNAPYKEPVAGQVEVVSNLFFDAGLHDLGYVLDPGKEKRPLAGDGKLLLRLWRFHHNHRDFSGPASPIPMAANDARLNRDDLLSTAPDDLDRVRPRNDSDLGTLGAGARYGLPAYIGALPPEGSAPWQWDRTWRARVGRAEAPK